MKYEVIARKFRPQVFEDVVGQNPIVQTLKNAIQMDRIGHAYLFAGPRGVGKTTTARLLAKGLNCENGPTATPCNVCASCVEITTGNATDVLEIDAASNTGVDSIRELRENARYRPMRDRFKVFIIDEIHMLSTSAFNALLKILEEPPEHIIFIMATTERHKLPATILSRCQQFVFRTIPPQEIFEHLEKIAESEGVGINATALEYIVKASEGSMRDAQSLLDQVIAFGGQEVSDEDVRDLLGFVPSEMLDTAVEGIIGQESKVLLDVVEVLVEQGLNLHQFARELSSRIRELLLVKVGLSEKILGGDGEREKLAAQAEHFSEQDLVRLLDVLLRLENDLRWTSQPRFHLEMGCVKLVTLSRLRDIEDVIRDLGGGASSREGSSTKASTKPEPSPNDSPVASSPMPLAGTHSEVKTSKSPDKPEPAPREPRPGRADGPVETQPESPGTPEPPEPETGAVEREAPQAASREVSQAGSQTASEERTVRDESTGVPATPEAYKKRVESHSETTALYLEQVEAIRLSDEGVEVRVAQPAIRDTLDGETHRSVLERAAVELLGRGASLSLVMTRATAAAAAAGRPEAGGKLREAAENEPLVKNFLEVFRGQIAHVKETDTPKEGSQ